MHGFPGELSLHIPPFRHGFTAPQTEFVFAGKLDQMKSDQQILVSAHSKPVDRFFVLFCFFFFVLFLSVVVVVVLFLFFV